ncbi:sensor histidine kinase [Lysinibacillus sp. NPDC056959]|uniref:ATP-binding protein n=1 Tax=Lysinibacillus sp. NPDC056959 TaxID=3345981 RepID=UPI0036251339
MADSSVVKRVIENLISNAIKHSSEDVTIQLVKNSPSVQLTILNPAKGLKEYDLHFLCDRFIKLINQEQKKYRFRIIYCEKSNDKDG